ncbi:unnamed protein product [Protopolystoma xenopodis]|uniref:Uncharacterized protein n=1 Tax=Protopolystoma xenopodis TaxID=117903 RepID=A0A3S5BXZ6_9PLAT|nr:unnamed protein product [Protopolystoma xenopodis]
MPHFGVSCWLSDRLEMAMRQQVPSWRFLQTSRPLRLCVRSGGCWFQSGVCQPRRPGWLATSSIRVLGSYLGVEHRETHYNSTASDAFRNFQKTFQYKVLFTSPPARVTFSACVHRKLNKSAKENFLGQTTAVECCQLQGMITKSWA